MVAYVHSLMLSHVDMLTQLWVIGAYLDSGWKHRFNGRGDGSKSLGEG